MLFTLEDQPGDVDDFKTCITNRLRIKDHSLFEDLHDEILRKPAGVFLWVMLVVQILNKEYSQSGIALMERLADIPDDLSNLFKSILTRDHENMEKMEKLLLSISRILFAKDPLNSEEFRHALWSGLMLNGKTDEQFPLPFPPEDKESHLRIVAGSSKGLAEITKSKFPTVQFIHESVRHFLIKHDGLHRSWPELEIDWENSRHEKLKQCCLFYLSPVASHHINQIHS